LQLAQYLPVSVFVKTKLHRWHDPFRRERAKHVLQSRFPPALCHRQLLVASHDTQTKFLGQLPALAPRAPAGLRLPPPLLRRRGERCGCGCCAGCGPACGGADSGVVDVGGGSAAPPAVPCTLGAGGAPAGAGLAPPLPLPPVAAAAAEVGLSPRGSGPDCRLWARPPGLVPGLVLGVLPALCPCAALGASLPWAWAWALGWDGGRAWGWCLCVLDSSACDVVSSDVACKSQEQPQTLR